MKCEEKPTINPTNIAGMDRWEKCLSTIVVCGGLPLSLLENKRWRISIPSGDSAAIAEGLTGVRRAFHDKLISLMRECSSTLEKGEGFRDKPIHHQ